jgi:hypothetical protein
MKCASWGRKPTGDWTGAAGTTLAFRGFGPNPDFFDTAYHPDFTQRTALILTNGVDFPPGMHDL